MIRKSPQWERLRAASRAEVPSILKDLCSNLQTPDDGDAAWLVQLLQHGSLHDDSCADCFLLLVKWARRGPGGRTSLAPSASELLAAEAAALAAAALPGLAEGRRGGAAALAYLGSHASQLDNRDAREEVVAAMGEALLSHAAPLPLPAADLVPMGIFAVLPALVAAPDAACWLFTAMLHCFGQLSPCPTYLVIDVLGSNYSGMRAVAISALGTAGPAPVAAPPPVLLGVYSVLRSLLGTGSNSVHPGAQLGPAPQLAAAALTAGGLLEGLARGGSSAPALQPLVHGVAALLVQTAAVEDVLVQAACAVAIAQCHAACRLPHPTPATATCLTSALLSSALSTDVLRHAFASANGQHLRDPAAVTAAVLQYARSALVQQSPALCAAATAHIAACRLNAPALTALLHAVQNAAGAAHQQYRRFIVLAPPNPTLDMRPLGMVLAKLFVSSMDLLAAMASVVPSQPQVTHAMLPAAVLSAAADLQFCRAQTPIYAQLLTAAMAALPTLPSAAAEVAASLPQCAALESPAPGHGQVPTWLIDGVTAAKVQLLFTALAPCCSILPHNTLSDSLAPLCLLYLLHPHPPTSAAAHQTLCALIPALPPPAAQRLAPRCVTRWLDDDDNTPRVWEQQQQQRVQQLVQGVSTVVKSLPGPCLAALRCVQLVADKALVLAHIGAAAAAAVVFSVAAQQLFHVHFRDVDGVKGCLEASLRACPGAVRPRLCASVFGAVAGSDDCVRKPGLARWYQRLVGESMREIEHVHAVDASQM